MPLLMCPNCQSNMQTLNRSNVEFDMCPSCRGVWLDRGELEKLMEGARAIEPPPAHIYPQHQPPPRQHGGYYDERGEQGERGEHGERGYGAHGQRKRGMGIFDIFD